MARAATRRTRAENTITVTVKPTFGKVEQYVLAQDATVADLLSEGGFNANAEVRLIDGEHRDAIESDTILEDGDTVQIVSNKKVANG